jgi:hypothetical protein
MLGETATVWPVKKMNFSGLLAVAWRFCGVENCLKSVQITWHQAV